MGVGRDDGDTGGVVGECLCTQDARPPVGAAVGEHETVPVVLGVGVGSIIGIVVVLVDDGDAPTRNTYAGREIGMGRQGFVVAVSFGQQLGVGAVGFPAPDLLLGEEGVDVSLVVVVLVGVVPDGERWQVVVFVGARVGVLGVEEIGVDVLAEVGGRCTPDILGDGEVVDGASAEPGKRQDRGSCGEEVFAGLSEDHPDGDLRIEIIMDILVPAEEFVRDVHASLGVSILVGAFLQQGAVVVIVGDGGDAQPSDEGVADAVGFHREGGLALGGIGDALQGAHLHVVLDGRAIGGGIPGHNPVRDKVQGCIPVPVSPVVFIGSLAPVDGRIVVFRRGEAVVGEGPGLGGIGGGSIAPDGQSGEFETVVACVGAEIAVVVQGDISDRIASLGDGDGCHPLGLCILPVGGVGDGDGDAVPGDGGEQRGIVDIGLERHGELVDIIRLLISVQLSEEGFLPPVDALPGLIGFRSVPDLAHAAKPVGEGDDIVPLAGDDGGEVVRADILSGASSAEFGSLEGIDGAVGVGDLVAVRSLLDADGVMRDGVDAAVGGIVAEDAGLAGEVVGVTVGLGVVGSESGESLLPPVIAIPRTGPAGSEFLLCLGPVLEIQVVPAPVPVRYSAAGA